MQHDLRGGSFSLAYVPALLTELHLGAQVYQLVATKPHIRRDGETISLLTWATICPGCEEAFTISTGLTVNGMTRRCKDCRKPRHPVARHRKVKPVLIEPADAINPLSLF